MALPGEQLRYLRSQGLHENESFSDIARLFLPGAAVVLFLAAHLLQSGSRECCEEEEERAEGGGGGSQGGQDKPGCHAWCLLAFRLYNSFEGCEVLYFLYYFCYLTDVRAECVPAVTSSSSCPCRATPDQLGRNPGPYGNPVLSVHSFSAWWQLQMFILCFILSAKKPC